MIPILFNTDMVRAILEGRKKPHTRPAIVSHRFGEVWIDGKENT